MADLTPEGPRDGEPAGEQGRPEPRDTGQSDRPLTRREIRRREEAQRSADESGNAGEAPPPEGPVLDEDRREYPELYETADDSVGTPVTVRPASRKGYQTITVNRARAMDAEQKAKRQARRRRRRRRNIVMVTAFGVFVLLVAGLSLGVRALLPDPGGDDYPGPGGAEVTFTVNEGEGALAIGSRLAEEDIVASSDAFIEAVNQSRSENSIQPGDYPLRKQMKASDAAAILLREGQGQVHYVAVNRGMRLNEVIDAVSTSTGIPVQELREASENPGEYGLPEDAPTVEGYLAPGEYRFPVDSEVDDIFSMMIEPTMEKLDGLGLSDEDEQFRAVTIASILEAEALTKDYPTVAGIIENRLHPDNPETDGKLQVDSTVIYGLNTRRLQFSEEEKTDASNEYNTYEHRGLPPGPIGAPSTEALEAAANPQDNDYYYWVTTNIETGETKFAETYEQHQVYQQEYRDYCAENQDICGGG
ncbi:endolytic transglycosylase MltG [Citricoccus sp. GCM10030269]|uniref:endolytic transglycosylase MltG n=1 Tax=Citricoccus sp. GCM10030269 TaxID=3273388 RepID=UPI00366EFDB7